MLTSWTLSFHHRTRLSTVVKRSESNMHRNSGFRGRQLWLLSRSYPGVMTLRALRRAAGPGTGRCPSSWLDVIQGSIAARNCGTGWDWQLGGGKKRDKEKMGQHGHRKPLRRWLTASYGTKFGNRQRKNFGEQSSGDPRSPSIMPRFVMLELPERESNTVFPWVHFIVALAGAFGLDRFAVITIQRETLRAASGAETVIDLHVQPTESQNVDSFTT